MSESPMAQPTGDRSTSSSAYPAESASPRVSPELHRGVTAFLIVVGVLLGCGGVYLIGNYVAGLSADVPRAGTKPLSVRVLRLAAEERDVVAEATGFLEPLTTIRVPGEIAGKIVEKLVTEGDRVEQNAVLARLDAEILDARVAAAKAQVQATHAQLSFHRKMLSDAKDLAKDGSIGDAEVDDWQAKTDALEATALANAATLSEAEALRRRCEIRAPRAGVWFEDLARVGEFLQPGTPLGVLRVTNPLELRVEVAGSVRLALSTGQTVDVELLDVDPSLHSQPRIVKGCRVRELPAGANPRSYRFPVVIEVPNREGSLVPGLYAKVKLRLPRRESILRLPKDVVVQSFGIRSVFVVGAEKTGADDSELDDSEPDEGDPDVSGGGTSTRGAVAVLREVVVRELEDDPAHWRLLSGVDAGEEIIVSPLSRVRDGIAIDVEGRDARVD